MASSSVIRTGPCAWPNAGFAARTQLSTAQAARRAYMFQEFRVVRLTFKESLRFGQHVAIVREPNIECRQDENTHR